MFLLLHGDKICAAMAYEPQVPSAEHSFVEIKSDAETYPWPNGGPQRCMLLKDGMIVANPAYAPPAASAQPLTVEDLAAALIAKGVLTESDIPAAKAAPVK